MSEKYLKIHEYPESLIDYLIAQKIPFEIQRTNSTMKLDSEIEKVIFSKNADFPKREMFFFNYVKSRINKDAIVPSFKRENIDYIKVNPKYWGTNKTLRNFVEIDINNAYFQTAKNLGYIDKETFDLGMKLSKKTRLASLGALAKSPVFQVFDGNKFDTHRKPLPDTAKYFFSLCHIIDQIMKRIFLQLERSKIAFYWVDAVFVHESEIETVKQIFELYELDCKIKYLKKIVFKSDWSCEAYFSYTDKNCYNFKKAVDDNRELKKDVKFKILDKI